ncbi:hypothetical protein Hanom_Chr10g00940021 [Helianthus anomalus]
MSFYPLFLTPYKPSFIFLPKLGFLPNFKPASSTTTTNRSTTVHLSSRPPTTTIHPPSQPWTTPYNLPHHHCELLNSTHPPKPTPAPFTVDNSTTFYSVAVDSRTGQVLRHVIRTVFSCFCFIQERRRCSMVSPI